MGLMLERSLPSAAWHEWLRSIDTHVPVHQLEARAFRDPEPQSARVIGVMFTLVTATVCGCLFSHRAVLVKSWLRLAYIRWLVILQYAGAFVYTMISAVLQYAYDPNENDNVCEAGAIICIVVYAIIKALFYLFLADRLHVVRSTAKTRWKSKLFIMHTAGIAVGILGLLIAFMFQRLNYKQNGQCVIGVERYMMLTGLCFDGLMNIYLTGFFLFYLSRSFSFRPQKGFRAPIRGGSRSASASATTRQLGNEIRQLAIRTLIGLGISLAATIINLAVNVAMYGEVLWLCFMTCKADLLLGVVVLYWITSGGRSSRAQRAREYEYTGRTGGNRSSIDGRDGPNQARSCSTTGLRTANDMHAEEEELDDLDTTTTKDTTKTKVGFANTVDVTTTTKVAFVSKADLPTQSPTKSTSITSGGSGRTTPMGPLMLGKPGVAYHAEAYAHRGGSLGHRQHDDHSDAV